MVLLRSSLVCSLAEGLHGSQKVTTIHVHCRAELISNAWYFGTWNLRSLFDNKGTVETARLSSKVSESEDQRIDLVIRELNHYKKVAGL